MKILCSLYQKSHSDMPDIEDMEVIVEDNKCEMRYSLDSDDTTGVKCNSEVIWKEKEGVCSDCGALYVKCS